LVLAKIANTSELFTGVHQPISWPVTVFLLDNGRIYFPPIALSFICLGKAWTSNFVFTPHYNYAAFEIIFVLVSCFVMSHLTRI
jgi:hypothetical protein